MTAQSSLAGMEQREPGGAAEFYPTPMALCEAMCRAVGGFIDELHPPDRRLPLRIIEPSAGSGNFVRAARKQWPSAFIIACDMARDNGELVGDRAWVGDWVELAPKIVAFDGSPDLILGNPPFSLAVQHIEAALEVLREGALLAFLLRLGFLGTRSRALFWKGHPLRGLAPIVERPRFVDGTSDNSDYGLFVWQKGWFGRGELLPPISWR